MTRIGRLLLILLGLGLCGAMPAQAEKAVVAPAKAFDSAQRAELEDFVRNFILDNPEVLMESVERLRTKQAKKAEDEVTNTLKTSQNFLYKGGHPEAGNPKGEVVLVEFFDYNCGYCKRAFNVVKSSIEKNPDLRVILLELPILSAQSEVAARWSLAAHKQGKYWEYHEALMEMSGPKDDASLSAAAQKLGLDVVQLKKDSESEDVKRQISESQDLARKLGVNGTPGFVLGEQVLRGYVDEPVLKTLLEEERRRPKK